MSLATALGQLARIIGPEFRQRLGMAADTPFPDELAPELHERALALSAVHADRLAEALIAEASASDDVHDAASATAYLDDRLLFLGPLLSDETCRRVRQRFGSAVQQWAAQGGP